MKQCKHPPDHVVIKYDCDGLPDPLELSWRECLDCGAWLPFGPSNDVGVEHEIRAAELAARADDLGDDPDDFMTIGEFNGWEIRRLGGVGMISDDRAAGYLACCIVEHKDAP